MKKLWRVPAATLAAVGLLTASAVAVSAHTHSIGKNGQVIANGQNHYGFVAQGDGTFLTCDTFTALPNVGPAWYGLETAHHGPDSGDAGKGDGCYLADYSPLGEDDDVNPAID
ncbi:MAG TPA: hypothetical protein VMQ65_01730 [Candidatus Limnocylindria bacterium]|nr:hypothetical protein [Candidatus Limnocylindria bacterium]